MKRGKVKGKKEKRAKKIIEKKLYNKELKSITNLREKDMQRLSVFSAILIILLFSLLLFSNTYGTSNFRNRDFLTGMVIADINTNNTNALLETNTIEYKIKNHIFVKNSNNIKACLIVPYTDSIFWSYSIIKIDRITTITKYIIEKSAYNETKLYCGGLNTNDLILKFNSYNSFINQLDSNSYDSIKKGAAGINYYILPSSKIEFGGNVKCTQEFINTHCDFFNFLSEEELIIGDMSCCINHPLTKEQIKQLNQHLASNPNYIDETGIAERANRFPFGENEYWFFSLIIIFVVIILAIGIILFIMKHKEIEKKIKSKKLKNNDKLINYINQAKQKGYTNEQIKQSLIEVGWSDEDINNSLNLLNNK